MYLINHVFGWNGAWFALLAVNLIVIKSNGINVKGMLLAFGNLFNNW